MVADLVAGYGQVIVDECHHISAFSFERVMREVKARYVVGLTATPVRRDGHQPIITMQCGPIRYRTDAKSQAAERPFDHRVVTRSTAFTLPADEGESGIQAVYSALARRPRPQRAHRQRRARRPSPLDAHRWCSRSAPTTATAWRRLLAESIARVFVISGGMGSRARRAIAEAMAATPADAPRVVVATGRCVGEGFDDARLDTLFLAMPVAWRGTLQQYAGRLHRLHSGKAEVLIYDYVDEGVPCWRACIRSASPAIAPWARSCWCTIRRRAADAGWQRFAGISVVETTMLGGPNQPALKPSMRAEAPARCLV